VLVRGGPKEQTGAGWLGRAILGSLQVASQQLKDAIAVRPSCTRRSDLCRCSSQTPAYMAALEYSLAAPGFLMELVAGIKIFFS